VSGKLSPEEREILDQFQRRALHPVAEVEQEPEMARQAARNTFNKTRGVNLRLTGRDFELARTLAREEGIPYQTLLTSVIRKYLAGRLVERPRRER